MRHPVALNEQTDESFGRRSQKFLRQSN